jgi:hypothetical protein
MRKLFFIIFAGFFMSGLVHSQDFNIYQKAGMCSAYHKWWAILSKSLGAYGDETFSIGVYEGLDANKKVSSHNDYVSMQANALNKLNAAYAAKDPGMAKYLSGICVELKLPVGRNTK